MEISSVGAVTPNAASPASDALQITPATGFDGLKGLFEVTCNGQTQLMSGEQVDQLKSAIDDVLGGIGKSLQDVLGNQDAAVREVLQNLR